ncbi:hypothetical protein E3N88_27534 [Mikania micrantha]|uniref:Uncharacterized protein n=1 Tax=Mikania micrantha TaxID=192012 RepID=A0A5N6MWX9_9ASTR|nr:hypothetical protein E3N88_27534 [Mikania micrantha]
MGFWDIVYNTGDLLKGFTPDLSTPKRVGGAVYCRASAAVTKIDQVVRVNGVHKLHQYRPDDETTAQIFRFTTTLAKNTGKYVIYEGFKHIPGATVASKLISDTMREVKQENQKDGLQTKRDKLKNDLMKSTENKKFCVENAVEGESEKTKDLINAFMKTEFVGNHMFHDLMIAQKSARIDNKDEQACGILSCLVSNYCIYFQCVCRV